VGEQLERRPLKTRERIWAKNLAQALVRVNLSPDHISLFGVGFACLSGAGFLWMSWGGDAWIYFLCAAGIQLRLLCNMLDGMVAIEGGKKSSLGGLYNELPDRIEDTVILLGAGNCAMTFTGADYLGWGAALVAILTAYIRALGATLGTPQFFVGPMAKPHRMATLTVACLLEAVTGGKGHLITLGLIIIIAGGIFTGIRRVMLIAHELERA